MILCVEIDAMKTSTEVQKDVNLEDLLTNHIKYFDDVEEALKEKYVPLDFSISVRSIYSNLVLQSDKEGEFRYYTNLSKIQPFIHKGYDLIMYLSSVALMYNIDYKNGFDELMTKHSQFQAIGLYNPPDSLINPIIYSHIIISDEGMKELEQYLRSDRSIVPISEMKELGNIKALLNTLIEVKEEKKDE